jgi:predicted RNase H-like HicB family nuclease
MARRQSTSLKQHLSGGYGYTVIYARLLEGGYQVIVPALPGVVTYGRTLKEAREMAEDAIRCHIRALLKDGEDIPNALTCQSTSSRASSARQG